MQGQLRYLAWHKSKGTAPFPVAEAAVYEFCLSCEDRTAPTFLKSFHTPLSFCVHVLGLSEAADAVGSPRVLGMSNNLAAGVYYSTAPHVMKTISLVAQQMASNLQFSVNFNGQSCQSTENEQSLNMSRHALSVSDHPHQTNAA